MPDGSYLSHGAAGKIGSSMRLAAMASATNSAYMAMRRVDQRPWSATPVECVPVAWFDGVARWFRSVPSACAAFAAVTCESAVLLESLWDCIAEDWLIGAPRFFHPDCTVGFGIAPNRPLARVAGLSCAPL